MRTRALEELLRRQQGRYKYLHPYCEVTGARQMFISDSVAVRLRKRLNQQQRRIPVLQQILRDMNECHREA